MNVLAILTKNIDSLNETYNVAAGERTTLNDLSKYLKKELSFHDSRINQIEIINGPERLGDIPHSWASIEKAKNKLNYNQLILLVRESVRLLIGILIITNNLYIFEKF